MMVTLAAVLGAVWGTSILLLLLRQVPPAPMDLAAAWTHLSQRGHPNTAGWGWRGLVRAIPDRLAEAAAHAQHPWLRIPTADLTLLETTPRAYIRQRLHTAGLGAMTGILLGIAPLLAGFDTTPTLLPITATGGVALGALWPVWRVREHAATARHEAHRALATFLELVAGERASGQAPAPALAHAAHLGQHWMFTRLQRGLTYAQRIGETPWSALRDLGQRLQIDALIDIADIADTASEGAAVYDSLTAHAASLRQQTRSNERATANAASERLTLPTSLLMISFLLLVLYPTAAHLLTT